jgi:hypothetical protein
MKRFLLLVIVAAVAAFGIWLALRHSRGGESAVTELLPKDTALLVHLPDLKQTRDQWHQSDVYQIWLEPAVQQFMQKPLTKLPPTLATTQPLRDFMQLEPKDAFVAVTAMAGNNPVFEAGFRFKGSHDDAEKVIGRWRAQLLEKAPATKRETADYQGHAIETFTADRASVSTVYDRDWFLASNDGAGLRLLLDRIDGRLDDKTTTLKANETYAAAIAHMPGSYSALLYVQPKSFIDKLTPFVAMAGRDAVADQMAALRRIDSFCGAFAFDGGKMRDVSFVAMPQATAGGKLSRDSAGLGTNNTFLYSALLLGLANQQQLAQGNPPAVAGPLAKLQQIVGALAAQGITVEQWQSAFGDEIGLVGDWAENTRWPSLLLSVPVKDVAKAKDLVDSVTKLRPDQQWTRQENDNVLTYSLQSIGGFVPVIPTIAVSDKLAIAGTDLASVEGAMKRTETKDTVLTKAENYVSATRQLGEPTNAFVYVDTKMLFERLDVALRPLLLMGAAFVPALSDNADFTKLPPAEVVAKHLSPIVMSQRYDRDGYVTESIGPITSTQAAIGLGAAAVAASSWWNMGR